ncbi:putative toxin-antitoxin system antitoxin component [Variovorax sp. PBL-H6]|uniref:type II RES/Xre toxin-antitoxin system antitoxin n=1 Tax=Variovorax sp. PBL-H6 TaxID=434009 RepID=UPI001319AD12|nr:antitoxin Xre-like helix-turn-helix domain-containing protein [Variovorax sp. PBL-H6]VTU20642.1 putative toxin-antitoxin system antitoxin component [Variovorax sp. PBL-H6]
MTSKKSTGAAKPGPQSLFRYSDTAKPTVARAKERQASAFAASSNSGRKYFEAMFRYAPLERVELVKAGVPAQMAVTVAKAMGVSKDSLYQTLGLPRATIDRKLKDGKALSRDESSRVLGIARLVGQAQAIIDESGEPAGFNAAQWVGQWLAQPVGALGGRTPGELMDTAEGQAIVSNLLDRAVSGAYS